MIRTVNRNTKLNPILHHNQPKRSVNPAPASPVSPPAAPPNTLAKSNRGASCPCLGASGVSLRLLLSIPALDGKVGNISRGLGRGSSRKYGCERHSWVEGRVLGFRASSEESKWRPALVRKGNLVRGRRGRFPGVLEVGGVGGRRRDLALGRERKPGQVWGVGGPVRANI